MIPDRATRSCRAGRIPQLPFGPLGVFQNAFPIDHCLNAIHNHRYLGDRTHNSLASRPDCGSGEHHERASIRATTVRFATVGLGGRFAARVGACVLWLAVVAGIAGANGGAPPVGAAGMREARACGHAYAAQIARFRSFPILSGSSGYTSMLRPIPRVAI
jgi:hypothetical protein